MLDFLGIGAQKAGTTWVYECLKTHPQIAFPLGKEVHYWNREFQNWTRDQYLNPFRNIADKKAGEITPAYAFLPPESIREIYNINPELKIFYIIRNPIDRAWSAAKMMLKRSEMVLNEASDQWFKDVFSSEGSRIRGNYIFAIDNWLSVFPQKNMLVVGYDELQQNIRKICSHLGVEPDKMQIINEKVHATNEISLRPSLRRFLEDMYEPEIERMRQHKVLRAVIKW
jgi:hypothetical protein